MQQFSNAKVTDMSRIFEKAYQGDTPLSTLKRRFSKGTFLKGLRRRCRSKCLHLATESFLLLAAGCLTDTKNLRLGGCY